jgi:hypothetical protein
MPSCIRLRLAADRADVDVLALDRALVELAVQIDSLLEDARSSLSSHDLEGAEDSLRRAGFELRKLFKAVGG